MGKYVGIDLGTTYSVVAYIDQNGNPQVIPNTEGDKTTPSAILFDEGKVIIGEEAKKSCLMNPGNYEAFIKRHMGEKKYSFHSKDGEVFNAEELSALILKKLRMYAEEYLGDTIEGAVITVPAYFFEEQRKATLDAAKIAGLPVLGLINEPTAAALSYGIVKGEEQAQTILVYDLGGGTFDICLLRFDDKSIECLASHGNRYLGGFDFDNEIINFVKQEINKVGLNIEKDPVAMQNLVIEAEKIKKTLSSKEKTKVSLFVQGKPFSVVITREQFESMIDDKVYDTILAMNTVMEDANLDYEDIDKILLVGGSTRIPYVQRMIEEETGIIPSKQVNPDEAVAIGAAYHVLNLAKENLESKAEEKNTTQKLPEESCQNADYGDMNGDNEKEEEIQEELLSLPKTKEYTFTDVLSHGIGVIAQNSETGELYNSIILCKNSSIPISHRENYVTIQDYQDAIDIQITQGDLEDVDFVKIIGKSTLHITPKKAPVNIGVEIQCDQNGLIHVRVIDIDDNVDLGEMKIDRIANMTDREVEESSSKVNQFDLGDE